MTRYNKYISLNMEHYLYKVKVENDADKSYFSFSAYYYYCFQFDLCVNALKYTASFCEYNCIQDF